MMITAIATATAIGTANANYVQVFGDITRSFHPYPSSIATLWLCNQTDWQSFHTKVGFIGGDCRDTFGSQ